MPEEVAHAGALTAVALCADHFAQGGDGLLGAVALDEEVGIDAVVLLAVGGGEAVFL